MVHRLIDRADVFLQNLSPGAASRLGFGAGQLRARRPELVAVSLSGYGAGGPMEQRKAYDMLIQAEAGLISLTGTPETPVKTGIPTADIASGMYCSQAVLAALLRRWRTGEGATIDVSMFESTIEWLGHALYTQLHTGDQPPRMGLSHSAIAPYDAYPTRDGEVLIGVQTDSAWRTLAMDALQAPELAADPRFATNVLRVEHRDQCDAEIGARTRELLTADLTERLSRAQVPAAQVSRMSDVVAHPQLQARDRWRRIGTENADVDALLPPATFADVEAAMGDVPALGQHTHALLLESGLDPTAAADLITQGVAAQPHHSRPSVAS
jgi:itaconate CoA-transferase